MPDVVTRGTSHPTEGRFVFHSVDGDVYVVVSAAPESALLDDHAAWKLPR